MFSKKALSCIAAALFFFYAIASLSFFNVLSTYLMGKYSLSASELGLLSSGYLYANAIFLIPAGFLFDRFSTRGLMLISMGSAILGVFLIALAPDSSFLLIGRIFGGIASGFVLVGTIRTGVKLYPAKAGKVIGLMISFGMMGGYFGNVFFSGLSAMIKPQITIIFFGLIGGVILAFMLLFQMDTGPKNHKSNLVENFTMVVSNPSNWAAGFYVGLMNIPVFVLGSLWGVTYLNKILNISLIASSQICGLIFLGVMIGSTSFGYLSDHFKKRKLFMWLGAVLSIIFMLSLTVIHSSNFFLLAGIFILIGFSITSQVIAYPLIAETNKEHLSSLAQGFASTINNLLGAIAQPLFGVIISWHLAGSDQTYSAFGFNLAFILLACAFTVAFITVFYLRETFCKPLAL